MGPKEFQAALDAQAERLRKEFARQKPWFAARFAAIKADPMTAAFCVVVAVLVDRLGWPLGKWFLS